MLWNENEEKVPIAGHANVEHSEGKWFNHSVMKLLSDPPVELKNEYEIEPFPENRTATTWTSLNPVLGKMEGTFVVIGDSILSTYRSESGEYSGGEYFLKEDDTTYQVKGVLFKNTVKISSWDAILTKNEGTE
jgi:hypothetical protein